MSSSPSASSSLNSRYVAPDFKRRQLLFDSFTKLGAAGGSSQKNISDSAVNHGASAESDIGPKGTLLYTWGAGYHGQLGHSTTRKKCRMIPACIDFKEPVLVVACGGFHTAVLTDDGRVYSFGDGRYGQLGNLARKHNMHSTPHLVDWLVSFKVSITNISCGQYHTAAISNQGKLFTWGSGKWGQLGHSVRLDERFPRKVEVERSKMGNFIRVACGDRHTAVINDEGRVITMGSGQHGQLGHGNGSDQLKPAMIVEGPLASQYVTSIDCGATTTAAVTNTGLFYLWGFGESIHPKGCSNIQDTPRLVKVREPVKQVACGQAHILVLTDAGDVYAFGMASMGQIGHGSRSNVRNPRLVLRGKEIHQIDAGRYHSMAVSAYGVLYSWGCGESGQLGHNTLESELFPKIVENILPSVVGQISCGEHHSFSLTSIAHSSVSADVLNWKLIEDEELKLKRAMLHDVPNGLKSKHILQVEQERKGIIRQLAESLKKEREDNGSFAQLQMSLIRQPEELVEDVRNTQEDLLARNDPDAIAQVNAMAAAAAKLMLSSSDNGYMAQQQQQQNEHMFGSGNNNNTMRALPAPQTDANGSSSSRGQQSQRASAMAAGGVEEEEEEEGDIEGATGARSSTNSKKNNNLLGSSASEAVIRGGTTSARSLNNVASSPDLLYEEETKQQQPKNTNKLASLKHRPTTIQNDSQQQSTLGTSSSTPSLHTTIPSHNNKQLAPLRPSTALTVIPSSSQHHNQKSSKTNLSRTDYLDGGSNHQQQQQPDSPGHEHTSLHHTQQALIEFNSTSSNQNPSFQPLAPRVAFAERTGKALNWVKDLIAIQPNSASVVNYNVIRLQKQFNALKAIKDSRTIQLEGLKSQLALCKPSADEEEGNKQAAERIKQLNMKLVTLNTRLMEAEENKRNYELYIIRMKEEDLQLSKQIEHLRQLVTEYDRLLSKVERMSQRVIGQKGEISEELSHFQADIAEFVSFADSTVTGYRTMLNNNFRKNQRMDSELERKMETNFDASRSTLSKLESQLTLTDASVLEHREKLESWEDKVEFYEKRFRKLSNSTGLSRSEQIIAKHYFNSEITNDLKLDIEYKQDTLLALQSQHKVLEGILAESNIKHMDSRWRDVADLEEANVNAVNKLLRAKSDSELWAQKVTLVEEGLLQLARAVQTALAKKDGLTPEQQQQLVLIGSNPVLSFGATAALDGAIPPYPAESAAAEKATSAKVRPSSSALLPAPEKGLRASDLERAVESQLEILLSAVEREKVDRVERDRIASEADRTQAARRRALEESSSQVALELAKTFIAPRVVVKKQLEMDEPEQTEDQAEDYEQQYEQPQDSQFEQQHQPEADQDAEAEQ